MGRVVSAGILLYRKDNHNGLEFFLLRPGGPFYKRDIDGIWTLPKGEVEAGEHTEAAARREFEEETGYCFEGGLEFLTQIRLNSKKSVHVYYGTSQEAYPDIKSTEFEMEYPKGSGLQKRFPEIVEGAWFQQEVARVKISEKLRPLLDLLASKV